MMNVTIQNQDGEEGGGLDNLGHRSQIQNEDMAAVEKMRGSLQFYFMNPLEKWSARRQFPYKLALQVFKIIFVTFQLCLFATYRSANVNYVMDNKISFSHLFLRDWNSDREITTYPETDGPLAVYTKGDFYDSVDFAVNAYANLLDVSIGPYFYNNSDGSVAPINFCQEKYDTGQIFGFNDSYIFNGLTETECVEIPAEAMGPSKNFSSQQFFQDQSYIISFQSLLEAHIRFTLKTVRFRDLGPLKSPDCFHFDVDIRFNNRDHDGQMLITLEADPQRLPCNGDIDSVANNRLERFGWSALNYSVIAMCVLSFILCCRTIYRAQILKRNAITFFQKYYHHKMTVDERLEFLNFWFLLIIFNDILIIVGSAMKEQIENKELAGNAWNICSLFLGVGNLLVWFGVLRYLGFFNTYNVLILTMKRATPNVLRFLICAMLIYAGFTFCGWLILGPYHVKFNSISTTSECLFAIINGDDIFGTFASMSAKSSLVWWFCRVYLYAFCSLFIYVVLSLFIALIMDAYETIKLYYTDGFQRSVLQEFIIGADIVSRQSQSPSLSGSPGSPTNVPTAFSRQQSVSSEMGMGGRRSSLTTAGGILDTIVETICRCNTPSPDPNFRSSQDGETQPLLQT